MNRGVWEMSVKSSSSVCALITCTLQSAYWAKCMHTYYSTRYYCGVLEKNCVILVKSRIHM